MQIRASDIRHVARERRQGEMSGDFGIYVSLQEGLNHFEKHWLTAVHACLHHLTSQRRVCLFVRVALLQHQFHTRTLHATVSRCTRFTVELFQAQAGYHKSGPFHHNTITITFHADTLFRQLVADQRVHFVILGAETPQLNLLTSLDLARIRVSPFNGNFRVGVCVD